MPNNLLILTFDKAALSVPSKDSLCIAKKVNGVFNVAFDNAAIHPAVNQKKLLRENKFKFNTNYRVYFANTYEDDALISVASDPSDIAPGQFVRWDGNELGGSGPADAKILPPNESKTSFVITNAPPNLHAAVQAQSGGSAWSTIFVDPEPHMAGSTIKITPKNEYLIYWYEQTDTEYVHEVVQSDQNFKFTFPPGDSTKRVRFGYATPDTPADGEEQMRFYSDD